MNNIEEAYECLGLTAEATRQQLEKRYQLIVRKVRAQEVKGTLTVRTEAEMLAATRAYRYILEAEALKVSSAYRSKRYGRFKRFSTLAENVDHFITYHKFALIFSFLFLCFVASAFLLHGQMNRSKDATTASAAPSNQMSVMIVSPLLDPLADISSLESAVEHSMLSQFPAGMNQVHVDIVGISDNQQATSKKSADFQSFALVSGRPDLYLVNREHFVRLFQMGYLRELAPWGSYGVNVSGSEFANALPVASGPLIAAISVEAENPEQALQWIENSKKGEQAPRYVDVYVDK